MVDQYSELYETFRWHVPKGFNLASACCFQWSSLPSHERRAALIQQDQAGNTRMISYAELAGLSSQLANGLIRLGVIPGDRVLVVLKEPDNALAALLACWAIGAVAVPLAPDASADELLSKFKHARAQIALIDQHTQQASLAAIGRCPRIKQVIGLDVYDGRVMSWRGLIARQSETYTPANSLPSDPALLTWPPTCTQDLPAQSALVLPHQTLIGQLPGFVASLNWFPKDANHVLTTLKPWQESGLLAAILPALYFGHTVVLTDKLPHAANLPAMVTHVVTSGPDLLSALKSESTQNFKPTALAALCVLEHELLPFWRERATEVYGTNPNLATFIPGFGLILAQSHQQWDMAHFNAKRVIPGHQVRLMQDSQLASAVNGFGHLEVSRIDAAQHTDPALYVQAWPLKDMLDLSAQLPAWCATGIYAQALPNGCYRVLGAPQQWHLLHSHTLNLRLLEQAIEMHSALRWCKLTVATSRKPQNQPELWALIDIGSNSLRLTPSARADLKTSITNLIRQTIEEFETPLSSELWPNVRVGVVDHASLPAPDERGAYAWHTRAVQSLIDFL